MTEFIECFFFLKYVVRDVTNRYTDLLMYEVNEVIYEIHSFALSHSALHNEEHHIGIESNTSDHESSNKQTQMKHKQSPIQHKTNTKQTSNPT